MRILADADEKGCKAFIRRSTRMTGAVAVAAAACKNFCLTEN
jgi:hypothetical protein